MAKDNLANRLIKAQSIIKRALKNEKILAVLTDLNYGNEVLKNGLALYEEVSLLVEQKQKEYDLRLESTRLFNNALNLAVEKYLINYDLVKLSFKKNPRIAELLLLDGPRKKGLSGWVSQAEPFYTNLLNDQELLTEVEPYGLTKAILEQNCQEMQSLVEQSNSALKAKSADSESDKIRTGKIAELDSFIAGLEKTCKEVFAERPEVLTKLGITKTDS